MKVPELELKDYWIDQYEVTNRRFKEFVDGGGYGKNTQVLETPI